MQSLEFERIFIPRQPQNRRDGVCVMGGELRVYAVRHFQKLFRATDIGHIRRRLSCENRKIRQALDLSAFDLGVPIGSFDQPNHDPAVIFLGQCIQPVKHRRGTFAIGLYNHAKPVPTRQRLVRQHSGNNVQRQVQTIGFFGINIQTHICVPRHPRQDQGAIHQFAHNPVTLGFFITRMKRRQFDRNTGVLANIIRRRPLSQRLDRITVYGKKSVCVRCS